MSEYLQRKASKQMQPIGVRVADAESEERIQSTPSDKQSDG